MSLHTFLTPDALFEALLGPGEPTAHVTAYRRRQWLAERNTALDAADARLRASAAEILASIRANREATP